MKRRPDLTIVTATWNRRHLLERLYLSLLSNVDDSLCIEWIVVDDGSSDGTFDFLNSIGDTNGLIVVPLRVENGGKHRALNFGIPYVSSDWFVIIDSDDVFVRSVAPSLISLIEGCRDDVVAIASPMSIIGFPESSFGSLGVLCDFEEWKDFSGVVESSFVFNKLIYGDTKFPEVCGEKFIAESSIYSVLFRCGGILLSDLTVIRAEYQSDGLTAKSRVLRAANPIGATITYGRVFEASKKTRNKVKASVNFYRYLCHAYFGGKFVEIKGRRMWPLLAPFGFFAFIVDKFMFWRASRRV